MSGWRARVRARRGDFVLDLELEGPAGPLALVGPNGSGKTTFLRALAGATPTDETELHVDARALHGLPMEARGVGYVPQGYGLFPHLSALDNVAFGLSTGPKRQPREARRARARALLDELGCPQLADRRVAALSGGEQQRVALARALLLEPALLLLDEPLAALDATTRRAVRRFLAERLRALPAPSILVTHDVRDLVALEDAGLEPRVAVIEDGRLTQQGPLEDLRAAPASDFVAELVGGL